MKNRTSTEPTTPTATSPICWQREAASACLRIELLNGETHLFPYTHLVTARHSRTAEDTETLQLTFSTNEVQIEGHNLRDLVLGIQDFAIKWLRAVPDKYSSVVSHDGVIKSIRVASVG
jgi:hypothetical protein